MKALSIMMGLCLAASARAERVFEFGPPADPGVEPRRIGYSFTAANGGAVPLPADASLWVAAPALRAAGQEGGRIVCTHDAERSVDAAGNQELSFSLAGLAPYGQRIIAIECELHSAKRGVGSSPPTTGPQNSAPIPSLEGSAKRGVGSSPPMPCPQNSAPIPSLEGSAKRGVGSSPRRIFDGVVSSIAYDGYHKRERGAAWALEHGRGDCSEFAAVFVERCQAGGIPARRVSGYRRPFSGVLLPAGFHTWAEFRDGGNWHPVDPQRGEFDVSAEAYVALRIHERPDEGATMFRYQGEGLRVRMNP